MCRKTTKKWLSFCLAVAMLVSVLPLNAFSVDSSGSVTNYADFLKNLKTLEQYADEYAAAAYTDAGELVLNFIRTGVERYQDDNWTTLAGKENTAFTNYVKAQDAERGTTAMCLKDIVTENFVLPNGNQVDFGHMFGCMNISYVAKGSADLSGWAGDLCDLLRYCVELGNITGTVEEMAAYIRANCMGVDAAEAFGWDDFWGDMDAYYLITEYANAKGGKKFSEIMEKYFTNDLDDVARTVYFMNNRFGVEDSREAVRKAIYQAYSSDTGIKVLESKRGLSSYNALREACCYAIADYIYDNAKGKLIEGAGSGEAAANGYYTVFSNEHSILAPGIEQDINYAQTVDGKQIVYYVATVDVNDPTVMIMANYKDNDPSKGWGLQTVMDQTNALVKNYKDKYEYFTPVVATNGDGYNIYNGTPGGLLVMDGKEWYGVDHDGFFAILNNGKAVIGTQAEYDQYKDQIKEAIGGFGAVLVKDGKINVTKNANYTASRASRTAVGITEDGKVVMMVMDGRQQPFSAGGSMEEIAQVMLEAGCVHAINLDGGGSTTYLSKPAGSDSIQLVNRPSDGYQRMVAVSLVAVSTAKPSNEFDKAIISSDYEYITAGTSMQFNVTGVSNTGNAAVIPSNATWRVSDGALATIDPVTGLFTAAYSEDAPVVGDVTVEFVVDGKVYGSKVIHIVIPDDIKFVEDRITAIYGQPKEIGVTVWYKGKPVAFTALWDVGIFFADTEDFVSDAGVIDGLTFTGDDSKGVRITNILLVLAVGDDEVIKQGVINLYYKDEATFDFDNATSGNRALAWLREIENARSTDNKLYRVIDPTKPIKIDYTFALDMTAIEMPAQLEPLKSMLPDGTNPDVAAWSFLLSLAERICTQTNVTIRVELSKELDVDLSHLKVVTDYFELTSANLDENNVLTLVCNWKDQTQAIDPATANSLCLLTGISATIKDTANYFNNEVVIANNGTVSYDIYLATSALYSFASDPANQAQFGLYPYVHSDENYPDGCRGDDHDTGGHFSSQYLDFADIYVVNTEILQGWQEENGEYYYYKDNAPVTGIQLVTDRKDPTQKRVYEFDQNGKLISEQGSTGLLEINGNLYYPAAGVLRTGWWEIDGNFYYFHPDTGAAVDGKYTIRESKNSWQVENFEYTFENHILTKGVWLNDSQLGYSGWRYRWAGDWIVGEWFEVEGKWYFSNKNEYGYVRTGYQHYIPSMEDTNKTKCYLFDEKGALMSDFNGPAYIATRNEYRYFVGGVLYSTIGFAQADDGYYYHVTGSGVVSVNTTVEVNASQGHTYVDAGKYEVDQYGRLIMNLLESEDNKIANNTKAEIVEVIGRVLTVKHTAACKVLYKNEDGEYVLADAMVNPYGTSTFASNGASEYNFAIEKGAKEIQIVLAGDLNFDGVVNEADEKLLADALNPNSNTKLSDLQALVADLDGDGEITIADRAILARCKLENDHPMYKELEW